MIDELKTRLEACDGELAEIREKADDPETSTEELEARTDELIEERGTIVAEIEKAEAVIAEEKRAMEDVITETETKVIEIREEKNKMTDIEIRNSAEYMNAYAEYIKSGDDTECRALLTENAEDGTIAVPTYVEDVINTAWESNELMKRVKRTTFPGVLRVGVEVSSDGAQVHAEGDDAIDEEDLEIAYVSLVPAMLKKMVRLSDEVMDMRGQAFIDYVYDEIEYQIVKTAGDAFIEQAATDSTSALIAEYTAAGETLTTADIIGAEGELGAEASNPILFTTRATAAALKAAALAANYGYDPFDGMEVIYVDAAPLDDMLAVIADPSAFQINLPNGNTTTFKFDDLTEAAADMVRIIGRLYAALGIVAPGRVVRIAAGEEEAEGDGNN